MTVTVEQFTARLAESRLLTDEQLAETGEHHAHLEPDDSAEDLARRLVEAGPLTACQTQAIWQKKHKGLLLGNYAVLEKLGEGGMGVVFKAEHRRMSRIVALKALSPRATSDPVVVERFRREVRAAAQLTHSNIVAALDADESHGLHFLVMEYVDGRDLSRVIKEKGPLPVDVAVPFIIQAARGLEHAHSRALIHRDIKPSNLLVDPRCRTAR